jgi:hypothetical protein
MRVSVMLSVTNKPIRLSVITLNVIMMSVVAPILLEGPNVIKIYSRNLLICIISYSVFYPILMFVRKARSLP